MVYIDTPRRVWFKGRERLACHCTADSLAELHDFAEELGLPRRAFENKPGRPHYDLFDEWIELARSKGAQPVLNRELVNILRMRYDSAEQR